MEKLNLRNIVLVTSLAVGNSGCMVGEAITHQHDWAHRPDVEEQYKYGLAKSSANTQIADIRSKERYLDDLARKKAECNYNRMVLDSDQALVDETDSSVRRLSEVIVDLRGTQMDALVNQERWRYIDNNRNSYRKYDDSRLNIICANETDVTKRDFDSRNRHNKNSGEIANIRARLRREYPGME